jgi:hypothetical protein
MTSSTGSSRRLRNLLAAAAILAFAWLLPTVAFGALASYAETNWGVFLWRGEEWMELFDPKVYVGRGAGRVMVIGPSESREALVPAPFEAVLSGFELFNDSMSFSTLEDGISQLEYIERVYGADAFPELLILAVTQRYVLDFAPGDRPLPVAIDKYSSALWLDESVEPQRLVPKHLGASLLARLRLAGHGSGRFRDAIAALRARLKHGSEADWGKLAASMQLVPYRYHHRKKIADPDFYWEDVANQRGLYRKLRDMPAEPLAESIAGHFERLRALAARHGTRVFVLNMPEAEWRRAFYAPGIYEEYQSVLTRAAGSLPILDLRTALPDERYFDTLHLDREGAYDFSRRVAELLVDALEPR